MIQGKPPSPSDDIYALGCIVYELLSGHHPYLNVNGRKVSALDALGPPPKTPRRIESLNRQRWEALRRTLQLKREARTVAVVDFLHAFEPKSFLRRNAATIAASALVTVAGSVALGAHYYRGYIEQTVAPLELARRKGPPLTAQQRQQIADYLAHAQEDLNDANVSLSADDLSYILSDGANNVDEILKAALRIDPNNARALTMKAQIADLYARKTRELIAASSLPRAMQLVNSGLKVKPSDRELVRLQREICARDNNACMGAP
jgi:serine/threonine protein kinase